MQAEDMILGFTIRLKLYEDRLPCCLSYPIYRFSKRIDLVPWFPVSPLLFVRKRHALCLGPMSPIHILTREDDVMLSLKGQVHITEIFTSTQGNHYMRVTEGGQERLPTDL